MAAQAASANSSPRSMIRPAMVCIGQSNVPEGGAHRHATVGPATTIDAGLHVGEPILLMGGDGLEPPTPSV